MEPLTHFQQLAIGLGSAVFEGMYVDGLSITFSAPMNSTNNHIWTSAAGFLDQTLIGLNFTQCTIEISYFA